MKKFKLTSEIEAEIYYLRPTERGRMSSVFSGYRGQFFYKDNNWDAIQVFIDKDICDPGQTVKTKIQFISPENHKGKFSLGMEFEIREGVRIVGKGKITKILREDYKSGFQKTIELLFQEENERNYAIESIENPDFSSNKRVHNWANYIDLYLQVNWFSLDKSARIGMYYMATIQADKEEWD